MRGAVLWWHLFLFGFTWRNARGIVAGLLVSALIARLAVAVGESPWIVFGSFLGWQLGASVGRYALIVRHGIDD